MVLLDFLFKEPFDVYENYGRDQSYREERHNMKFNVVGGTA